MTTAKVAAYAKRNDCSSAVPLDPDSDSDFNPGSFVPEIAPNKRRRRTDTRQEPGSPLSKRRRKDILDNVHGSRLRPAEKVIDATMLQKNLLAQFFGQAGIAATSDSELDEADNEEDEDEEEDKERDSEDEGDRPLPVGNTVTPATVKLLPKVDKRADSEDSVTEYESDEPEDVDVPSTQAKPASAPKTILGSDESATEPELEEVGWLSDTSTPVVQFEPQERPQTKRPLGTKAVSAADDSGSETEPEPETDPYIEECTQPLPAFQLEPGQQLAGPLSLDRNHKVPARINTFLREYQREGIKFFWERYSEGRGGLLGDDMGLGKYIGKTIQVISFLSAIMQKRGDNLDVDRRRKHVSQLQDKSDWKNRRALPSANATWATCLIIAPSSVVGNWEREFETWGYFEVGIYMGPPGTRTATLNDFKMGRLDLLLTSFDVARTDIDLIDELPWSCIFIDEVHRVKNPKSKLATAFSRFTCACRFGLSGTVIQNDYEELWTVLNWTNPGAVGSRREWGFLVEKPLRVGQSKSATDEEHVKAALVAKILKDKLLPQLFLRRTKEIIQNQLPLKTDQVVFCPLTPTQLDVYKRVIGLDAVNNLVRKDDPCDCESETVKKARKKCCYPVDQGDLFKYMSTLIKISNHLALILPSPSDTTEQTARNRELSQLAFPSGSIPKYGPSMLLPEFCGKWMVLDSLLKDWRSDSTTADKVLIFTKSVKLLEMLEFHLNSEGYGYVKLDGATKQSDRMPMIDRFQEDPDIFIFLISTMAGGTGLNLTAANKVVIFDPNWNPAHDLQAMDRAYRFGQTRDVSVFRLLGAGSIEELIYARQIYKQQQMQVGYKASLQTRYFEGVQGDKTKQGELFGVKNIFKLHEHTLATKMAIEQANVSDLDWAFAHMGGGAKRPKNTQAGVQWVYEEEAKTGRDYDDLRGLGALLFDDAAPEVKHERNNIEKTLEALGVQYSHRNDALIAESTIEGQRMEKLIEEKKKAIKRARQRRKSGKDREPEPEWPPRRKHHKAPLSPDVMLRMRQRALLAQGILQTLDDLPKFAQEFAQKSREEQNALLGQLDDYAKKNIKD